MSSQQVSGRYVLLPYFCKRLGLALVALALAAVLARSWWAGNPPLAAVARPLVFDLLVLGLLLVSWSRDRDEDELTTFIRLKALAGAFTQAVLYVIIAPLLALKLSGEQVVLTMLIVYLLLYYPQKWYR